jgi:hypothetical protein
VILEAILATVGTIVAAYVWEIRLRDRLIVRRITKQDDDDIEGLLEIYTRLFPDDGTNYSTEDILDLVVGPPAFESVRLVACDNILLVARVRRSVVGFVFCHFYPTARKAIISYLAIDSGNSEAKACGAARMLQRLRRILSDPDHLCEFLFFDLQGIESTTPQEEAKTRKARPVLFRRTARRMNLQTYDLQFAYQCPKVSLEEEAREHPCTLVVVPLNGTLPDVLLRSQVLEFLRFIHLDCYGDLYPKADPRCAEYQSYLRSQLRHYESTLPPEIPSSKTKVRQSVHPT